MSRLIDAEKLHYVQMLVQNPGNGRHKHIVAVRAKEINEAPTVDAVPMELLNKAIDYVEEYICNKEKNTYRAQGMADALTMIEQFIKENKDED